MLPIAKIARQLGLSPSALELYGPHIAKIRLQALRQHRRPHGQLINITSITPTPAGEGKTCTAIGLTQALGRLRKRVALCLREPSLGPLLGVKGGATGAGKARVVPSEAINLHFTGDIHAIGVAHNFLAACVDNAIVQGNHLKLDPAGEPLRRAIDIPDRQLRHIVSGLGGRSNGVPRESGFDITAASEIMAILALASDLDDLKQRLSRIIVGYTKHGKPVRARELKIIGALAVILKDALLPNLVQTLEGQPALVHAGPFANVSHGNSSIVATQLALARSEYVITESGFGADLGAEKFFDIVCPLARFRPDAAVVVVSLRALKVHGGMAVADAHRLNLAALEQGLENLGRHLSIVERFRVPAVVALNRFPSDTRRELSLVQRHVEQLGVPVAISEVVARGGWGGVTLARAVLETLRTQRSQFRPLYGPSLALREKIERIACEVYGAAGVRLDRRAEEEVSRLERLGFRRLPVNIAKTQLSFTDDPAQKGAPTGWYLRVREVRVAAGAGFVIALCGKTTFMPGLSQRPLAMELDVTSEGRVVGLA